MCRVVVMGHRGHWGCGDTQPVPTKWERFPLLRCLATACPAGELVSWIRSECREGPAGQVGVALPTCGPTLISLKICAERTSDMAKHGSSVALGHLTALCPLTGVLSVCAVPQPLAAATALSPDSPVPRPRASHQRLRAWGASPSWGCRPLPQGRLAPAEALGGHGAERGPPARPRGRPAALRFLGEQIPEAAREVLASLLGGAGVSGPRQSSDSQ